MTKHRLADRDVFRRFVRLGAQTVTEAVPAKALAILILRQAQRDCGRLDEIRVRRVQLEAFSRGALQHADLLAQSQVL